jgi:hypothetical protein
MVSSAEWAARAVAKEKLLRDKLREAEAALKANPFREWMTSPMFHHKWHIHLPMRLERDKLQLRVSDAGRAVRAGPQWELEMAEAAKRKEAMPAFKGAVKLLVKLPVELVQRVLSFVPAVERARLACVHKTLHVAGGLLDASLAERLRVAAARKLVVDAAQRRHNIAEQQRAQARGGYSLGRGFRNV